MLGAIPDYDGLKIDPCLPKAWPTAQLRRPFRGAVYEITVNNPWHVSKGVKSITVDGQPLQGNIIPPHGDGKVHQVVVVLGPEVKK
jgi:cellobiose phosphorylase